MSVARFSIKNPVLINLIMFTGDGVQSLLPDQFDVLCASNFVEKYISS